MSIKVLHYRAASFLEIFSANFSRWQKNFKWDFNNKRKREIYISQESVKKKPKETKELRELALKEIASLNDEICHLEDQIDQTEYTSAGQYTIETLQRVTSDLLRNVQPSSLQEINANEIEKDIDALQSWLSLLDPFTGIKFVGNSISMNVRNAEYFSFAPSIIGNLSRDSIYC